MIFDNSRSLRELLAAHGRERMAREPQFALDDGEFERVLADVRWQHPNFGEEEANAQAAFRLLTKAPRRDEPEKQLAAGAFGDLVVAARVAQIGRDTRAIRWLLYLILAGMALLVMATLAKASPVPKRDWAETHPRALAQALPGLIVQVQNQGTPIGTFPAFLVLNCSTNMSCSASGTTVSLAASSTAGSAFSAITTGTNTTATMTVGSGGTLGFSGSGVVNASSIGGVTVSGTPVAGEIPIAQSGTAAVWADPVTTPKTSCGTTVFNLALGQVPTTNTVVTSTTTCVIAILLNNGTSAPVTVTVKDGQATPVPNFTTFTIQPNSGLVEPLWGISFTSGLQWVASAAGVTGAVFGFQ